MSAEFNVIKKSGDIAPFDSEKLLRSLLNSGAGEDEAQKILSKIQLEAYDGMPTKAIYRRSFELLRRAAKGAAARYKLKEAITQLGTTGYPFERYIGELFIQDGYKAQVGKLVEGYSIMHEVDVIAENSKEIITVECKYHQNQASKSDVKVPMYILSRYVDINNKWAEEGRLENKKHSQAVATNTRFTDDAQKFAADYNISLISWDYPDGRCIKDWIGRTGVYPITCLYSLTKQDKHTLISRGLVSCRTVYEKPKFLNRVPIRKDTKEAMLRELKALFEDFF